MLRPWLRRLVSIFNRGRLDQELDEEIATHLEMATAENVRRGMSLEDARQAARRSFGGVEQVRERHREDRGFPSLEDIGRDLRLAGRTLLRDRGFTATVVVTLTVGIGANTAIFSVIDAVLLAPLPYPNDEQVVKVTLDRADVRFEQVLVMPPAYEPRFTVAGYQFVREQSQSFQELGAHSSTGLPLTGTGEPVQASVGEMTNSAFAVLAVSPQLGRLPADEEDSPGGPRVALLSDKLWAARFGSDPNAVGQTIALNDTIREVIGVMPPEFAFPSSQVDVWVPLQLDLAGGDARVSRFNLIGRLRQGVTNGSASAEAQRLIQRLPEVGHPPVLLTTVLAGQANVITLKEGLVGNSRHLLLVILGAVTLVMLIALSNVATLFLVRAEQRTHQRAVRAALGASRRRLIQHALSEALLLATAGGLGGLVLALVGTRVLVGLGLPSIPRLETVGISPATLGYTTAVSVISGLAFALLPSMGIESAKGLAFGLSAAGRSATAARERLRLRGVLVATQVALAVGLLVGSGLMAQSYARLRSVDPGFDPANLIAFDLLLPATRYSNTDAAPLYLQLVDRLRGLPDVESAAVTTGLSIAPVQRAYRVNIEDFPELTENFLARLVTPGFFETMRIPVVGGRTMLPEDVDRFRFFISASLAEQYWSVTSAPGKRMGFGRNWAEVMGVVGDDRARGLDWPVEAGVYLPIGMPSPPSLVSVSVLVRTRGMGTDLVPLMRDQVGALDPELPLINVRWMHDVISESDAVSRTSFAMLLLSISALVALLLGAVGIYGVIAYVVSCRTSEIGIRKTLGAPSRDIWSRVVGTGLLPVVIGLGVGLAVAAMASRVLTSLLFETSPFDTAAFVTAPAALLVVAAAACVVPARRAMQIDPVRAVRSD